MKFRNPYGEDRVVPALNRIVQADEVVDVPDALADGFHAAGWSEVTPKKQES